MAEWRGVGKENNDDDDRLGSRLGSLKEEKKELEGYETVLTKECVKTKERRGWRREEEETGYRNAVKVRGPAARVKLARLGDRNWVGYEYK